uniref:Uncharacterized protein n=1 Tax=Vespula pensylvanica TaxID=30213 RepID=A0A834NGU8_VESPE|nr:hypothetical protein H0235_014594 [Vespula pensylvanica]
MSKSECNRRSVVSKVENNIARFGRVENLHRICDKQLESEQHPPNERDSPFGVARKNDRYPQPQFPPPIPPPLSHRKCPDRIHECFITHYDVPREHHKSQGTDNDSLMIFGDDDDGSGGDGGGDAVAALLHREKQACN